MNQLMVNWSEIVFIENPVQCIEYNPWSHRNTEMRKSLLAADPITFKSQELMWSANGRSLYTKGLLICYVLVIKRVYNNQTTYAMTHINPLYEFTEVLTDELFQLGTFEIILFCNKDVDALTIDDIIKLHEWLSLRNVSISKIITVNTRELRQQEHVNLLPAISVFYIPVTNTIVADVDWYSTDLHLLSTGRRNEVMLQFKYQLQVFDGFDTEVYDRRCTSSTDTPMRTVPGATTVDGNTHHKSNLVPAHNHTHSAIDNSPR